MAKHHRWVFIAAIAFFLALAVHALLSGNTEYLFDRVFAAALVGLIWVLWRRFKISDWALGAVGLAIVLHQLKLYGNTYFGIEFDNYMHAISGFAIAAIVYQIIDDCDSGKCHHPLKKLLLTFCAAYGTAALIEPLEYFGYATVGNGEGILGYGAGDGGWRDTAFDLIANMIGAAVLIGGVVAQKLWVRWKKYGWKFKK